MWGRENKYHNRKVTVNGITFDSAKEASRWQELRLLEQAGEIVGLNRQVKIELIPATKLYRAVTYVADFVYFDKRKKKTVYEDVKGMKTDIYKLKKKSCFGGMGSRFLKRNGGQHDHTGTAKKKRRVEKQIP